MADEKKKDIAGKFEATRRPKRETKLHSDISGPEPQQDDIKIVKEKKARKPRKLSDKPKREQKSISVYPHHIKAIEDANKIFDGMFPKNVTESATVLGLMMYAYEELKNNKDDPKFMKKIRLVVLENTL